MKTMITRITKSIYFQFIFVYVVVFTAFYFYRDFNLAYFVGEDSYFHVAVAKLMMQQGLIIHQFPYLKYTILNQGFADWHFGFHALLIPFIKIFGDIVGPKILGTALVSATFGVSFLIFKKLGLKLAFLYAIMLFFLMPDAFYLRMTFIRGAELSLFLTILAVYFFIIEKPLLLAAMTFLFVWSYPAASYFIFVPLVIMILIQLWRKEKINYSLFIWSSIGFILGFVLNPYFPKILPVLWAFIKVGNNSEYEGVELLPPTTWSWFYSSLMAVVLFLTSMVIVMVKNIKIESKITALFFFSLFLLILQWKSSRFVEYWPVFGALVGIVLIGKYFEEIIFNLRYKWKSAESIIVIILIAAFIQEGLFHGIWNFWTYDKIINGNDQSVFTLKEISEFIGSRSQKGDLIFARWDIFPQLFYFNDKNYYVDGNAFIWMKKYNEKLAEDYVSLTQGITHSTTDPKIIKDEFNAQWVVSEKELSEKLDKEPDVFKKEFEKNQFKVYKVL